MIPNVVYRDWIHMMDVDRFSAPKTLIRNSQIAEIPGDDLLPDVLPLPREIEVLIDPSFGAERLSADSSAEPKVSIAL